MGCLDRAANGVCHGGASVIASRSSRETEQRERVAFPRLSLGGDAVLLRKPAARGDARPTVETLAV